MTYFSFTDYRKLLRHWIKLQPHKGRGAIGRIADHLGVNATLISQILSGSREMSIEHALELADFMSMMPAESDYFIALVQIERAGTEKLKKYWKLKLASMLKDSKLIANRIQPEAELNEAAKATFYSSHLYSAIRLFCSIEKGKSLEEICERFQIARNQAVPLLDFLESQALIIRAKGLYRMGTQSTHIPQGSPHLYRHHTNWRLQGLKKVESVRENELVFTCPCSIDEETFQNLKSDILDLIAKAGDSIRASNATEIACLNIDLFWIDRSR